MNKVPPAGSTRWNKAIPSDDSLCMMKQEEQIKHQFVLLSYPEVYSREFLGQD